MIGFQKYIIDNKIKVYKLAKEININPSCIYDWFRDNRVTPRYIKILAEKFNLPEDYINKQVNNISTYKPKVRKFNDYKIMGDTTIIYLKKRDGRIFETLIDTEDLERIIKLDLIWFEIKANTTGQKTSYAQATEYLGCINGKPSYKTHFLNKEIMQEYILKVDHRNHDTLDNRKQNLRITTQDENLKHRSSRNSNNKSGYRNVCMIDDKWIVQLQIDGKNTKLGSFTNVDEAGIFAEQMRQKYYGEFAGNN